ncbi:unnamed protein product, partial [Symbiodinium necroappetens]
MVLIPKDEVTGAAAEVCLPYFHGGIAGRNAWQALKHIEASWDEEAILVSSDFEKCFDNVVPALALDNLRRHGCPEATVLGASFREDALPEVTGPTTIIPQLLWGFWWNPRSADAVKDFHKLTTLVKRALDVVQQGSRDLWLPLDGRGFCFENDVGSGVLQGGCFLARTGAHTWQHAVVGDFDLSGRRHELADLIPDDVGYDENVLKAAIKLYNGCIGCLFRALDRVSCSVPSAGTMEFPSGGTLCGAAPACGKGFVLANAVVK